MENVVDDHLHYLVNVVERLFFGAPPRHRTLLLKGRAVGMPTSIVRLDDYAKNIALCGVSTDSYSLAIGYAS